MFMLLPYTRLLCVRACVSYVYNSLCNIYVRLILCTYYCIIFSDAAHSKDAAPAVGFLRLLSCVRLCVFVSVHFVSVRACLFTLECVCVVNVGWQVSI